MIQEEIGFSNDQMIFVGDQFGYPGTSSPFLALHEGIQTEKIKRGDHVLFWTIGTGYEFITMLYKYWFVSNKLLSLDLACFFVKVKWTDIIILSKSLDNFLESWENNFIHVVL